MKKNKILQVSFLALAAGVLALGNVAQATTVTSGNYTGDFVTVGDAGNAADTNHGFGIFGAVGYSYQISSTEVTNDQYVAFLNSVAQADPLSLWNLNSGITRSGSSGSYTYTAPVGGNLKPAMAVSWYDAARFTNWATNGGGVGADTETGAYTLTGGTATPSSVTVGDHTAFSSTTFVLPTQSEWYKAAYYKGGSLNAGYWTYTAQNNTVSTAEAPPGGANSANAANAVGAITDVGAYVGSISPYGTFDQGGNVWEWSESSNPLASSIYNGGSYFDASGWMANTTVGFQSGTSTKEDVTLGFRVGLITVPEPGTAALLAFSLMTVLFLRRRRSQIG